MTPRIHAVLATLALAACALALPASAQVNINISLAPPQARFEPVPVLAPGQAWAPGYWGWSGERHVWVRGRPILQRPGYRWEPDRWVERDRGYHRTAGHWTLDKGHGKAKKVKKAKHEKHNRKKAKHHGNRGRDD